MITITLNQSPKGVGAGPKQWNEQSLISGVLDAIN